jgi:hypothetical protein
MVYCIYILLYIQYYIPSLLDHFVSSAQLPTSLRIGSEMPMVPRPSPRAQWYSLAVAAGPTKPIGLTNSNVVREPIFSWYDIIYILYNMYGLDVFLKDYNQHMIHMILCVSEVAIEYGRWWLANGSRDSLFSDGPSFKNHQHMDTNGRFNLRRERTIFKKRLCKFKWCEYSEWFYCCRETQTCRRAPHLHQTARPTWWTSAATWRWASLSICPLEAKEMHTVARAQNPSIPVIGKTKRLTWKSVNCHGHLSIWDGHLSSSIHFDASSWQRYVPCMLGGPFRSFRKTTSSFGLE